MPKKYTAAHVLVFAFVFSTLAIFTRLALDDGAHPLTVITVRTLGVVAIVGIFLRASGVSLRLGSRDRHIAFAIGVVVSMNNFALTYAMAVLPVPLVVLVFYTYPAVTSIVVWLLGTERPNLRSVFALLFALCGLALALEADLTAYHPLGLAFSALGAFTWTAVLLLSGHFFRGSDPRPRTFYMQVAGAGIFVAASVVTGIAEFPHGALGWSSLAALPLAYAIGFVGLLAATGNMGATRASFYMNFEPIATLALSAAFLNQTLTPVQLLGAAMVIVALFLFRPLRREPLPAEV